VAENFGREVRWRKAHLGLHTTRCWTKPSVLREVRCLLGLFSLVALIFRELVRAQKPKPGQAWADEPIREFLVARGNH
jgi:hypothetical protein